ncbi:PQQ-dependent sugar dehydrogenase [Candidatus Nitrosocosmicus agrestis]|jgi:glucose/arabinose dehydrogenase/plastocyanin|uniref:PQQ-dependent sugar dehydrogenase n=1 Tax=Candidatus Nitrosocosmicus agrestis TaxID=2563600 RepID=UPI00122E05D7|nr:PQQ-dependent sugar dehydrogenase [Candidatus Nitrosocosmicus sp. SS]KAA2283208.1 quinoprotein glucose dehydrogenase [Candidatus Nitrosocosmicus sp. SS]KAF0868664.1 quinoprotein glucose dehydrogenase [Candidatus Nitrosocosmicus sp. SS]MDR4489949.1 PQQ-dependent sugar dehydrogenase [Candidatus Nitrosocosmicus sp.]
MVSNRQKLLISFFAMFLITISSITSSIQLSYGAYAKAPLSPNGPTVNDDTLTVEKIADDLEFPTSMAFLGPNDILVTEKTTGKVMRVTNGIVNPNPVLDVPVANGIERGLLGIAVAKQPDGKIYVFLSYTESGNGVDGSDVTSFVEPLGNRLYRYEFVDGRLINPVLLLDLTAVPVNGRGEHNGGKIRIGPDNNVYYMVGEVGGHRTQAQNILTGPPPNGLGGVLRITQDGGIVDPANPIFGKGLPLNIYYAMGIRNSFGMDFDPLTGNLWDTENGPAAGDEINLVFPGFNSGWYQIQGFVDDDILEHGTTENDLVVFGSSQYADPKFVWDTTIGITALKFLNSHRLGDEYANNMFVGDINNGLLYRFTLNEERDAIFINSTYPGNIDLLQDNEVDDPKENQPLIFAQGFGGITDIEVGPDGYLYVLSYTGSLFRILPISDSIKPGSPPVVSAEEETLRNQSVPAVILGIDGDDSYSPNPIEINVGQTVTWYNGDTISHTVTSGADGDPDEGTLFDSDAIIPSQYYSLTFNQAGDFPYYCIYHPTMVGEVVVDTPNSDDSDSDDSDSE